MRFVPLALLLVVGCASYDPGVDYRSALVPFETDQKAGVLDAGDFGVPMALELPGAPNAGGTVARAEALLAWMGSQVTFDGSVFPPQPLTAPVIWKAARNGHALNCLAASTLFASLAQGAGLSARILSLYPRDLSDENHVVVLIWYPEESRWLVADPSYRTLFYDEGRALGPLELRTLVADGRSPGLSPEAGWNARPVEDGYIHYLSKNLYRWSVPGAGMGRIQLVPPGYGGFGPPWGFSTVVRSPVAFLGPP